jgi:hypothetical protein
MKKLCPVFATENIEEYGSQLNDPVAEIRMLPMKK